MLRAELETPNLTASPFRGSLSMPALEVLEERLAPANLPAGFIETAFIAGFSQPTSMQLLPDGRIFVAEQGGTVRVIKNGQLLTTPFLSVIVDRDGERGLLGVTVDPNFANNHFVYIYYTVPSPNLHNRVSRFTANGDVAADNSELVLLDLPALAASHHNGGGLHFGQDGKLYIGVGENGIPANAQSLNTTLGKILRINSDGSIPADNPFLAVTSGINQSIYALGFRNP